MKHTNYLRLETITIIMIHELFLNYAQTISYQIRKIKIALLLKTDIFNRFFHLPNEMLSKLLTRDHCLNSFRYRRLLYYITCLFEVNSIETIKRE